MKVLEIGSYVIPAMAGMLLREQGHRVVKWINPNAEVLDPVQTLLKGDELWAYFNEGKQLVRHDARHVGLPHLLRTGSFDIVIDNVRAATWEKWGVDPARVAAREGVAWVSMRDDFDGLSFDAIAQARAWGNHQGILPMYLGDTTGGLWLAFKALNARKGHHYVLRQATALAKLVEGELAVRPPRERDGLSTVWDRPGDYGPDADGSAKVEFRGQTVREPLRDDAWRRENLHHKDGRYII